MFVEVTSKKYSESYIKLVEGLSDGMRDLMIKLNTDNQQTHEKGFYYSRGFKSEDSLNPAQFSIVSENYGEIAGITIPKSKWRREKKLRKITYNDTRELFARDSSEKLDQREITAIRKRCEKTFLIQTYGVADSIDRIKSAYKFLEKSDRMFVCFVTPIYREHQPSSGGFRSCKWGPYIGSHKLTHEYLYDQIDVDVLYVYHIHEVKQEKPDYSTDKFDYKMTRYKHGVVINKVGEIVADIGFTKDNDSGERVQYVGHWKNWVLTIPEDIIDIVDVFKYIDDNL